MKLNKRDKRKRIHKRIRKKVSGNSSTPRLSVFRSNKGIYCQLINDLDGSTICSASIKDVNVAKGTNKVDQAKEVGKLIAKKAGENKITQATFDRAGYLYHGRIKALADAARENGLII